MTYLPIFSSRIKWGSYLSRVTDQKISPAVTRIILPWNKVVTDGQMMCGSLAIFWSMLGTSHEDNGGVEWLSQHFSGGIRPSKWTWLIILLLCGLETYCQVHSHIINNKDPKPMRSYIAMCPHASQRQVWVMWKNKRDKKQNNGSKKKERGKESDRHCGGTYISVSV